MKRSLALHTPLHTSLLTDIEPSPRLHLARPAVPRSDGGRCAAL